MTSQKKDATTLMLLQMLSGAAAGAVAKTATAPLERLKIIFQVQGMSSKDLVAPKYTSLPQAFFLVMKEEGVMALWKGNGANVLRVIPVYGLKFAFNDSIKAVVAGPTNNKLSTSQLLWVGTLAGLMQTALTYPLETVRTRLTLGPEQGVKYNGILDCFRQMVKTEGVRGLFKGFGPTMVSGAPYTGLQMTSYEVMKRSAPDYLPPYLNNSVLIQLTAGAISGLIAQTVTYPGDTVRRRMQNNGAGGAVKTYSDSFHCTYMIWKYEGIAGFFKGSWTNTVRAVPGAAVQFAAYEFFKDVFIGEEEHGEKKKE
jgi:solute carrier family 25 phosphate transporter 23/24/25/41